MRKEGSRDQTHLHPVTKDHFGMGIPKCLSCGGLLSVVLTDKKGLKKTVRYPVQWTRADSQNKTVESPSLFFILFSSKHFPLFSYSVC